MIPSVDYVDASINDTMLYIMQEISTERAGRVAGDNLLQIKIDQKQGIIDDLDAIRSGAALGATAVQPNALVFEKGSGEGSIQTKGTGCDARGLYSFAEGFGTLAESDLSHAEG